MEQKRTQLWIALVAVLVALVAAVVAWRGLTALVSPVRVVEATTIVPALTPVSTADLTYATVPRGRINPAEDASSLAQVVGHMTLYGLAPGEIVTGADIAAYSPETSVYAAKLAELRKEAVQAVARAEKACSVAAASASPQGETAAVGSAGSGGVAAECPAAVNGVAASAAAPSSVPAPSSGVGGSSPQPQSSARTAAPSALRVAQAALAAANAAEVKTYDEQAVTVNVTEQQGFATVKPGDRVTIYGTVADQQKNMVAFGVANDVLVLGQLGTATNGAVNGAVSGTLVLALSPASIERLMLAQQAGSLQIALMPLGAPAMVVGTVTTTQLLGGASAAATTYPTKSSATAPGAVAPSASASGAVG